MAAQGSATFLVRPGISYTCNRSNIEINDYRRTEYLLTVRYDIR